MRATLRPDSVAASFRRVALHKVPPGKALTERALKLISRHPAIERSHERHIDHPAKLWSFASFVSSVRECGMEIPIRADFRD